ncbi:BPTI/Kunitz domain-containing protein [Carassius carassius]|uniref:BPTI/Kunitz domain-containing protein n=1 Tax=Carassius carassius TaxID=217509 RepID=UPI0028697B60|nr:BPTI/Kunitz domain-containing protein [Carassius carassius]
MRELGIILFIFAVNHNIQAQTTKSAACSLEPDEGTGPEANVRSLMYYNAEKDNCFPFRYFGSGGNANRFMTEKQCMRNCSHRADELFPMDERRACYLPKKPGECVSRYQRYYYSPEHNKCMSFSWTGCVGNGNRFLTLNLCNATCYNAADEGPEEHSGESIGIILGVVFGLIGAVILIVVIVFAVKKKPRSKKHGKKEEKSAEQPLKEQAIEMGGGEAKPATLEVSTGQP